MKITDKIIRDKCEALGTTSHKLAKTILALEESVESLTKTVKTLVKTVKELKEKGQITK